MKWRWVFVGAFLVLGLLAACMEGEEVVVSTAVPTPPPTLEPTVTETAVSANNAEETIVPTPTTIPTETPTPSSQLAEAIDLQTLPEVPFDFSTTYTSKTPDYDLLYDWLRAARETPDRASYYHIFDLLAFDFARSFPQGAGQLEPIYQENDYPGSFLAERLTWPVLQTAVVAYLNQNQINLKDGSPINILELTLNPYEVDLNKDDVKEWLVEVHSKELYIFGIIPLIVEQSGQYAILPNTIEPINESNVSIYTNGVAQGIYDFDFTGDKTIDILQAAQGYLGGPFGYINIYVWNGSGLYLLEKIDISVPSFKPYASFEVGDFTHDGVADVKVVTPQEVNFHCIWNKIDIYSWNGRSPHHLLTERKAPDTPYCAMFHAITPRNYYSEAVLAEKSRIELLEWALGQLTLETTPSTDYLALAYVHLAAAYAAQWDDDLAQQAISRLAELPAQAPFIRLVNRIYEEESEDVIALCERLYSEPQTAENTGVANYIYEGSITGYFGFGSEVLNPDAVCPYPQLITERLEALSLPANQHPATSLSQFGYTFSQHASFNLDSDVPLEWFGVVQKEQAHLVLFDEIDGILKPMILSNVCPDCEDSLIYELRQDEQGAYVIGRLSSYQVTCTLSYELVAHSTPFLVRATENGFDLDMIGTYCDVNTDERPLAELTPADFAAAPPGPPTWRSLLHEATGQNEWEWINELQTAVLTQTDPTIPEKITQLLNYFPINDPEAQPYIEHLTYLLGYFYELSGDEENAVSTYLDLIQRFPTSPWSWLAWARLEPVEG